jgi:hypothetical protein
MIFPRKATHSVGAGGSVTTTKGQWLLLGRAKVIDVSGRYGYGRIGKHDYYAGKNIQTVVKATKSQIFSAVSICSTSYLASSVEGEELYVKNRKGQTYQRRGRGNKRAARVT